MNPLVRKVLLSLVILGMMLVVLVPSVNQTVFHNRLLKTVDEQAVEHTNDALLRAATAYGVARGINALVSVIQDSQVNVAVASLALGQVLDPLNDIILRFSLVAMVAMASLGIQKVLITLAPWTGQYLLLPPLLFLLLLLVWLGGKAGSRLVMWCARLALLFVILQLSMPAVSLVNHAVYATLLDPQYQEAIQGLRNEQEALASEGVTGEDGGGWWGRVWQTLSISQMRERVDRLKNRTGDVVDHCVSLTVVFVLHSLLLPVGLLWLLLRLTGWVLRCDLGLWVSGFLPPSLEKRTADHHERGPDLCDM